MTTTPRPWKVRLLPAQNYIEIVRDEREEPPALVCTIPAGDLAANDDAALIVHAVNTLELVRVIIPAIKQTIERVRCLEAGQAITTEADNLLADIQDNLNIVLTNMDGKQ